MKESVKAKSTVKRLAKRWFIDAFSGMAMGLFATLIAGTIFEQIGKVIPHPVISKFLINIAAIAKVLMGAGIGAGIAYALKADKLTIFSCMVAGLLGANGNGVGAITVGIGNPINAYLAALISCEICLLISGKTKLDILLIPLTAFATSAVVLWLLCPPVALFVTKLSEWIAAAMVWNPFIMGIVISVAMGIILTMPTSSAAIWVAIYMGGYAESEALLLAGGAAVVGCAAHMVGFAVQSYRENGFAGLIAQGLGTSMLQIPNIMKSPRIIIPPIIASAVVGPMATTLFKLKCGVGAGMGTSGLVGVLGVIDASGDIPKSAMIWGIILLMFVLPAVISLLVCEVFRKLGWIKKGDMSLNLK
ncbi:MAG: PTS transporter subunit IIC [Christensenellales bacterium]|jgi:uncharacterized membrane protein